MFKGKRLRFRLFSFLFFLFLLIYCCHVPNSQNEILPDDQTDNQFEFVITVVSGNFQQGNNGEQLPDPIVIRFTDSQQKPRSNVPITFEILCGGGSLSVTSAHTDPQGQAEVYWLLGNESDHILKVTSSDRRYAAETRYVYANTYFEIETQWISGIPFRIEYETISHDDRILESNNFLTFSDASSDDIKMIYSKMAEDAFYELKQAFAIQSSEELGIFSNDSSTKITIFSNRYLTHDCLAFPVGFFLYSLDSPLFSSWWGGDQIRLREWYQRDVKHETMHVMQWLFGLDWDSSLPWSQRWGRTWPEFWFSEGIAEYISGGSFTPIETMDQVNDWLQDPDHINPVSIIRSDSSPVDDSRIGEYYPMFGLAVRYLLEKNGLGKTFLDVKAMYLDMLNTESFRTSFETCMGITVEYYEENFFDLITDFLNQTGSD
jgi:hypothetical protein